MKKLFFILLLIVCLSGHASASITVGGYVFDDNAFADTLLSSGGSFSSSGGSLSSVLTDKDAGTWAGSYDAGAFVNLGFTDNFLFNGSGADLVLFEIGFPPHSLNITIGSSTINYAPVYAGETAGGYNLNAAAVNLDDFGVAPGAALGSILIGLGPQLNGDNPALSLAGALNSSAVPIPAAVWLLGSGLAGLIGLSRKMK